MNDDETVERFCGLNWALIIATPSLTFDAVVTNSIDCKAAELILTLTKFLNFHLLI